MVKNKDAKRFACSGVSCMLAGFCTNPLDVIKIRLQLDNALSNKKNIFQDRYYNGMLRGIVVIVKDEGVSGLYKGVVPSVMREGIYSTFRLGAYEPVKDFLDASQPQSSIYKKIIAGAITGSIGSAIANPTDLVKVRMQGQGKLKNGERVRYRSTFAAFNDIIKQEGVKGLWRGVSPTVQRAAIVTASQIPSYDHIKHNLLRRGALEEGILLHSVSAFFAGFITAITTSPIDVIKTRVMNENIQCKERGTLVYSSSWKSFLTILRTEGLLGFYKGFIPNWLRIGPHTIITFLTFEQLRILVGLKPV